MRARSVVAIACLISGSAIPPVSAQVPAGAEFQINTYTPNDQERPRVAFDGSGAFAVVWYDTLTGAVSGQRYDATGARRGSEFPVPSNSSGLGRRPVVASDRRGNLAVVWENSNTDILARLFDFTGVARGPEFRVNTSMTAWQWYPVVALDDRANYVVAWRDDRRDGSLEGIFAQRLDASGAPRGGEFQVNSFTTASQTAAAIASDPVGNFVVVWESRYQDDPSGRGVFGQRFDAAGVRRGSEFHVNTYTTHEQRFPSVASDTAGNFVVVWQSYRQDGSGFGVFAQRYDAGGTPQGGEFRVNTTTVSNQERPFVAADAAGNFVVAWDQGDETVRAQRLSATGALRGPEFLIGSGRAPAVASDAVGNLVVAWQSRPNDGSGFGVFGRRYGGLVPEALAVDASASPSSNGNGVLEPGEAQVAVAPSWRNVNGAVQTFDGAALRFDGPAASGVSYSLTDESGAYGSVANGVVAACSDCYGVGVGFAGARPATHWDATFSERLTPDAQGQTKLWSLHVGESFADVPRASPFYRFVETLLHQGVTGGCSASAYCPTSPVTREQVAVFTLVAREGASYLPTACAAPPFSDVPASSPFCRYVRELASRGVVSGCGGGNYCPGSPVTREQMPVFVLRTLDPSLDPPPCAAPPFGDVPVTSPFCPWIAELVQRGVVGGCGGGNYCPSDPVTREQMAVFTGVGFGLALYGP